VEEVEALVVGEQRVGAMLEEKVDNVVIAAFRSPEDGRGNGIATLCVDGGAGLDEEVAEGVVVVDGSPLFTQLALGPPEGRRWGTTRTCSGVMPCSSLNVASTTPESKSFCMAPISPSRANCMTSSSMGTLGCRSAILSSSWPLGGRPWTSGCAAEAISGVHQPYARRMDAWHCLREDALGTKGARKAVTA